MKEADIRKYAKLMSELDLTGLEITENDTVVRLERAPAVNAVPTSAVIPVNDASSVSALPRAESAATVDGITVKSPMVGVFYAAPAENAEPYVKLGDKVSRGSVLCIIEAMKLMNEITAESDGEICEICVKNGQVVEFGTPLFRIKG